MVTQRIQRRWLFLAALALPLAATSRAEAHAILLGSTPAHAATLPPGEQTITLRFNSRIDPTRSRLTLTGPDGKPQILPLRPSADDVLETAPTLSPGRHVLRWQVLAIDGHITRGDLPFTVKAP